MLHLFFFLKCFILEIIPCQYIEIYLIHFKNCVAFHYMDAPYIPVSTGGI